GESSSVKKGRISSAALHRDGVHRVVEGCAHRETDTGSAQLKLGQTDRALLQGAPDAVELRELTPWAGRSPGPRRRAGPRRRRARARSGTRPCGLRELEVRVSELGLGYASEETVLFRYCAGACEAAARVYDLGLRRLRQRRRVRRERVRAQPCCRPTAYEDEVSFLDTHSRYHTVHELSARECAC
uniref:Neurturin n=1 Tax=Ovis aries TaxID=9940 RepID=A0AC11C859_SHEEP